MTRGFAAIEECRRADSHDWHFGLTRRLRAERKGGVAMNHLRTACVAFAFVATTVSGSAQTSLTPSQNTTNSRTIIPQPAPVMRERIVNPSAGSDIGLGAAEQPPTQNNVLVNGALAVRVQRGYRDQAAARDRAATGARGARRPRTANPGLSLRGGEGSRAVGGDGPDRSGRLCGRTGERRACD